MTWYVTCFDELHRDGLKANPEEAIWTVSKDPEDEGWNTDCGQLGYGLTKADAQELADAANVVAAAKQQIRDAEAKATQPEV